MAKNLLMISGDRNIAQGKKGAFWNTLEELRSHFDRIDIITPSTGNNGKEVRIFDNVVAYPSPWSLWFQPFWIFKTGHQLIRKYHARGIVVHEYPPFYNGIGAFFLKLFTKVPYILEIHHIPGLPRAAGMKEAVYRALCKYVLPLEARFARALRVVNRLQVPDFLRKAGIKKSQIRYIPSFYIDFDIFHPYDEIKKHDVVFAARLEKNKGIFNLITAIAIAKKQKPDISLLIVGHGSLKERLHRYVAELGLDDNILFSHWLPELSDVAKAYSSAKIFVNPSFNEGGPRVAIEAMACGVPVITTPVGAMVDLIKDGENGMITDWSPYVITDCIVRLLKDDVLRAKIGEASKELVGQFERKTAIRNYAEEVSAILGL